MEEGAKKRQINGVSSRNNTDKHSSDNCEMFVVDIEVNTQNVSNILEKRITSQKVSWVGITAWKGNGVGVLPRREADLGSLLKKGGGVVITAQKVSGINMSEEKVTDLIKSGTISENVICIW